VLCCFILVALGAGTGFVSGALFAAGKVKQENGISETITFFCPNKRRLVYHWFDGDIELRESSAAKQCQQLTLANLPPRQL
jgi:hypothetical protein